MLTAKPAMSTANTLFPIQPSKNPTIFPSLTIGEETPRLPTRPTGKKETVRVVLICMVRGKDRTAFVLVNSFIPYFFKQPQVISVVIVSKVHDTITFYIFHYPSNCLISASHSSGFRTFLFPIFLWHFGCNSSSDIMHIYVICDT